MILSFLLPACGALVLVMALAMGAMRCAGLAVSLWHYEPALSTAAGLVGLALVGGALHAVLRLGMQVMRVLVG